MWGPLVVIALGDRHALVASLPAAAGPPPPPPADTGSPPAARPRWSSAARHAGARRSRRGSRRKRPPPAAHLHGAPLPQLQGQRVGLGGEASGHSEEFDGQRFVLRTRALGGHVRPARPAARQADPGGRVEIAAPPGRPRGAGGRVPPARPRVPPGVGRLPRGAAAGGPAGPLLPGVVLPQLEGLQRDGPAPRLAAREILARGPTPTAHPEEDGRGAAPRIGLGGRPSPAGGLLAHGLRPEPRSRGRLAPHGRALQVLEPGRERAAGAAGPRRAQEQAGSEGAAERGRRLAVPQSGPARGFSPDRLGVLDRLPQTVQRVPLPRILPGTLERRPQPHQSRLRAEFTQTLPPRPSGLAVLRPHQDEPAEHALLRERRDAPAPSRGHDGGRVRLPVKRTSKKQKQHLELEKGGALLLPCTV